MRTMHALRAAAIGALVLGSSPAIAATTLPSPEEAQKVIAQAVNARAVTTLLCSSMKLNGSSGPVVDYLQKIQFGVITTDRQEFILRRNGRILVDKATNDWEHDRKVVDPQPGAFAKLSAAPNGCTRLPLGLYTVGAVSNIRAGDADQTALADYTFSITATSFGDTLFKQKFDPLVDADPLVAIPARAAFLSFYFDRPKPLMAEAKLVFDGTWHVKAP